MLGYLSARQPLDSNIRLFIYILSFRKRIQKERTDINQQVNETSGFRLKEVT